MYERHVSILFSFDAKKVQEESRSEKDSKQRTFDSEVSFQYFFQFKLEYLISRSDSNVKNGIFFLTKNKQDRLLPEITA